MSGNEDRLTQLLRAQAQSIYKLCKDGVLEECTTIDLENEQKDKSR